MGQSGSTASSGSAPTTNGGLPVSSSGLAPTSSAGQSCSNRSSVSHTDDSSHSTVSPAPQATSSSHSTVSPASQARDSALQPASTAPSATAGLASIADTASSQLRDNFEALHNQLMQHAGADYDIATTTTLSYAQFRTYIIQLNEICRVYQDDDGHVLVFAVKKGTDSSIFWKATVRIACVKYHPGTRTTESHRLLTIRQFLQVFRRISYECTAGSLGTPPSPSQRPTGAPVEAVAPTTAATRVLGELERASSSGAVSRGEASGRLPATDQQDELEECVICLERRPEVILPCAHAYCLPCIQQWWEYSTEVPPLQQWICGTPAGRLLAGETEKTCPVCRESVHDDDDTWVISEAPDDALVTNEISKSLMGLAGASGGSSGTRGGGHLARRSPN